MHGNGHLNFWVFKKLMTEKKNMLQHLKNFSQIDLHN